MKGKTAKVLAAYVLGQATQLIVHAVVLNFNMWNNRQIPFCMAAGFVVLFAVIAGVVLSETEGAKDEPSHAKTYKDYAEIPKSNMGVKRDETRK